MKAIGVRTFGGPDALEIFELAEPHPGPGELRIRVAAAAVNPSDVILRTGGYGASLKSAVPHIPGWDAAGTVDEVGEGAGWSIGDKVIAIVPPREPRGGAYAEKVVVSAHSVTRLPAGAGFAAASTLGMNGLTARLSLDQLALRPGQTLAATGAAGAYGGYVIQLAKADGLQVIADASEDDEQLVSSLGADIVVRRGEDVAERIRAQLPDGVDAVADGATLESKVVPAIRDGGNLAVIHGWAGPAGRGITVHQTSVADYAYNEAQSVSAGSLTGG